MSAARETGPDSLLAVSMQAMAAAEQRRDQQLFMIAALDNHPDACRVAEDVLREIERRLDLAQIQHAVVRACA
ncbi:MAG: hypothetical protein ACAH20_12485 [Methylobacteriaceae bacterium]